MVVDNIVEYKPVKQAFGSTGGKSYLAPKIVKMIPEHKTYVEPFTGGGAVYFEKPPSEKEVLNDKDTEIAFAYKFLRDMTPQQFEKLQQYDWTKKPNLFKKLKNSKPKNAIERFRRFYYLKKASFGMKAENFNYPNTGSIINIDHLPKVHDRMNRTIINSGDANTLLKKYDNKNTFFYLDPPYPGRTKVGDYGTFTHQDFEKLVDNADKLKGNCMISVNKEEVSTFPKSWHVKKIMVKRSFVPAQTGERTANEQEIIATNYNTEKIKPFKGRMPRITPKMPKLR